MHTKEFTCINSVAKWCLLQAWGQVHFKILKYKYQYFETFASTSTSTLKPLQVQVQVQHLIQVLWLKNKSTEVQVQVLNNVYLSVLKYKYQCT